MFMAARNEIYSHIIKITLLTQHAILRCNKLRKFLSAKQKKFNLQFITSSCAIRVVFLGKLLLLIGIIGAMATALEKTPTD